MDVQIHPTSLLNNSLKLYELGWISKEVLLANIEKVEVQLNQCRDEFIRFALFRHITFLKENLLQDESGSNED